MIRTIRGVALLCSVCFVLAARSLVFGQAQPAVSETPAGGDKPAATAAPAASAPASKYPPFADVVKEAEPVDGLIKMYHKGTRLYAELGHSQLDRDFIVLISIARGIGKGSILGGMSWGFGDDWIWQFRKVDERIHVVRRNVRFTAQRGQPGGKGRRLRLYRQRAVQLAHRNHGAERRVRGGTDADLHGRPAADFLRAAWLQLSESKSSWARIKGFKDNMELEVAATYASSGAQISTQSPIAAARPSMCITPSACCRTPAISRAWRMIGLVTF